MADDTTWLDLPGRWTYGVCGGGRVFFINDETQSTSWVHPGTGSPIQSGHFASTDLPKGWEAGVSCQGAIYFINHNERRTTFLHPVTGHIPEENARFDLQNSTLEMSSKAGGKRPATISSESSNHSMVSEGPPERPSGRASRPSRKGIAFGKRSNSMKRNPNAAVTKSGWLSKQASSGVKQWNKRWFVLVDRCLFYYKGMWREAVEQALVRAGGSLPLLLQRYVAGPGLTSHPMGPAGGGSSQGIYSTKAAPGLVSGQARLEPVSPSPSCCSPFYGVLAHALSPPPSATYFHSWQKQVPRTQAGQLGWNLRVRCR
uniref:Pleckstrin homology domain containing A5 n=1 Tax=Pelodiscus sinensis TaxID=13735 RepID=K7FFI3_PELSI